MLKKYHRDVWLGLGLLVFSAVVLALAVQIQGEACYLPVALSILMGVCAASISLKGLRETKEANGEEFHYQLTVKDSKYAFLFMFFIFLYYLGFQYITYWIATPVFLILTQKYLKLKSWKVNLIITVVYMIVSYITFVIVLKLPIYRVGILGELFRFVR